MLGRSWEKGNVSRVTGGSLEARGEGILTVYNSGVGVASQFFGSVGNSQRLANVQHLLYVMLVNNLNCGYLSFSIWCKGRLV